MIESFFSKRCAVEDSTKSVQKTLLKNKNVFLVYIIVVNMLGSNTVIQVVHFAYGKNH